MRAPSAALRQSLTMGAVCALIGLVAGSWVWWFATGEGYGAFPFVAPLAAFVAGTLVWWLLRARRGREGAWGGALAGLLSVPVGQWLCWYAILVGSWICNLATGGCVSSLGEPPMNPLQALGGATLYGGLSLLFAGWLTIPAGIVAGAWLGRRRRGAGTAPAPTVA